jgi:MFS family permease
MKVITRTVWILSLVSLFTDMASEMLYPVMPVYLQSIGFSVVMIGLLEGVAEATAGLSKGYFGKLSDATGRRMPFVQVGYALSAISKPLMAIFAVPLWVFAARTLDRFGKGLRTGARDSIISAEATPQTKGRIFGFHRSMDTLGAVAGPALALVYLSFYPAHYKELFLIAFLPGLAAFGCTLLVRDKQAVAVAPARRVSFFSFLNFWKQSPGNYKRLVGGLLFFTLFNSSDVFLLLMARKAGLSDTGVVGAYIFYNLVYAATAFPIGILGDRIGLKRIFIVGLLLFALTYAGFAAGGSLWVYYGLFFLYGLYAAATEGVSKAWISNIVSKQDVATAIGTYSAFQSLCALLASSLAGLLWFGFGAATAFTASAVAAVVTALYMTRVPYEAHK